MLLFIKLLHSAAGLLGTSLAGLQPRQVSGATPVVQPPVGALMGLRHLSAADIAALQHAAARASACSYAQPCAAHATAHIAAGIADHQAAARAP